MTKKIVDLEHLEKNYGEIIHWVKWKSDNASDPKHNRVGSMFTSLSGRRCVQSGALSIPVDQIIEISHHGRRW